jgi:hypothetical protein
MILYLSNYYFYKFGNETDNFFHTGVKMKLLHKIDYDGLQKKKDFFFLPFKAYFDREHQ